MEPRGDFQNLGARVGFQGILCHDAHGEKLGGAEQRKGPVLVALDQHVERAIEQEAAQALNEGEVQALNGVRGGAAAAEFVCIRLQRAEGGSVGALGGGEELVLAHFPGL